MPTRKLQHKRTIKRARDPIRFIPSFKERQAAKARALQENIQASRMDTQRQSEDASSNSDDGLEQDERSSSSSSSTSSSGLGTQEGDSPTEHSSGSETSTEDELEPGTELTERHRYAAAATTATRCARGFVYRYRYARALIPQLCYTWGMPETWPSSSNGDNHYFDSIPEGAEAVEDNDYDDESVGANAVEDNDDDDESVEAEVVIDGDGDDNEQEVIITATAVNRGAPDSSELMPPPCPRSPQQNQSFHGGDPGYDRVIPLPPPPPILPQAETARKEAEEEEAKKKKEEQEAKQKAQEAKQKAEEEAARKKEKEDEAKKKKDEQEAKKKEDEKEAKRLSDYTKDWKTILSALDHEKVTKPDEKFDVSRLLECYEEPPGCGSLVSELFMDWFVRHELCGALFLLKDDTTGDVKPAFLQGFVQQGDSCCAFCSHGYSIIAATSFIFGTGPENLYCDIPETIALLTAAEGGVENLEKRDVLKAKNFIPLPPALATHLMENTNMQDFESMLDEARQFLWEKLRQIFAEGDRVFYDYIMRLSRQVLGFLYICAFIKDPIDKQSCPIAALESYQLRGLARQVSQEMKDLCVFKRQWILDDQRKMGGDWHEEIATPMATSTDATPRINNTTTWKKRKREREQELSNRKTKKTREKGSSDDLLGLIKNDDGTTKEMKVVTFYSGEEEEDEDQSEEDEDEDQSEEIQDFLILEEDEEDEDGIIPWFHQSKDIQDFLKDIRAIQRNKRAENRGGTKYGAQGRYLAADDSSSDDDISDYQDDDDDSSESVGLNGGDFDDDEDNTGAASPPRRHNGAGGASIVSVSPDNVNKSGDRGDRVSLSPEHSATLPPAEELLEECEAGTLAPKPEDLVEQYKLWVRRVHPSKADEIHQSLKSKAGILQKPEDLLEQYRLWLHRRVPNVADEVDKTLSLACVRNREINQYQQRLRPPTPPSTSTPTPQPEVTTPATSQRNHSATTTSQSTAAATAQSNPGAAAAQAASDTQAAAQGAEADQKAWLGVGQPARDIIDVKGGSAKGKFLSTCVSFSKLCEMLAAREEDWPPFTPCLVAIDHLTPNKIGKNITDPSQRWRETPQLVFIGKDEDSSKAVLKAIAGTFKIRSGELKLRHSAKYEVVYCEAKNEEQIKDTLY